MAENKQNKRPNVPPLRFPEFTEPWEQHLTTDYFEFKNGLNPDVKRFGTGVKFISVMDILNNRYISYDRIISSVEPKGDDLKDFGVNYGDILFQRSSETLEDVGRANVYLDKRTAIFGGFVIRGKKIGNYDPLFFRYLLTCPTVRKRIIVKGAGAQHFNIGQDGLSKVHLSVPSEKEQKRISDLLNLIDERIETQSKLIEDLQQLKSALYQRVFSSMHGQAVALSNIADIIKGKQINGTELFESGDYYVMNGGIVPSGYYNDFNTPANTISISEGGNSCGYVQFNDVPFWSGGHCYTLQITNNQIGLRYLFHFLKYREQDIMALRIGSGLPNIQKKDLERFQILIPNVDKQQRYAKFFDYLQHKEDIEVSILNQWQLQKQYLLGQMFI